jgi:hypothetical protein
MLIALLHDVLETACNGAFHFLEQGSSVAVKCNICTCFGLTV